MIPLQRQSEESSSGDESETVDEELTSVASMQTISSVRENMLLGKFVLDPIATDFIGMSNLLNLKMLHIINLPLQMLFVVIPKQLPPIVEQVEPYSYIPQWAIAVIVIGMASLLFVIVFGVAVVS